MNYEKQISNVSEYDYFQPIGHSTHVCDNRCVEFCLNRYFSKKNIDEISKKITEILQGVDNKNRRIIVPDKTINSIMISVYKNFIPEIGDIYSRYIQYKNQNMMQIMIDEVINIITTDVKTNLGIEQYNSTLTIWTTILGDFNKHKLRSHPELNIKKNTIHDKADFNLRY